VLRRNRFIGSPRDGHECVQIHRPKLNLTRRESAGQGSLPRNEARKWGDLIRRTGSLVSEGLDRVHLRGTTRGVEAEEDTDGDGDPEGEQDRAPGDDRFLVGGEVA
jgi:hypothetical protein